MTNAAKLQWKTEKKQDISNKMQQQRQYFYSLNSMRFFFALIVVLIHVELYRGFIYEKTLLHKSKLLTDIGPVLVSFFFVISGFLISYFLLSEKIKKGSISYKKFYKSRILRIWPLYYLVIIIYWKVMPNIELLKPLHEAFFFVQQNPTKHGMLLSENQYFAVSMLFLPQFTYAIAATIDGIATYATFTWSIGTEEFFYLFWPFVLNKSSNERKGITKVFIFYFVIYGLCILALGISKYLLHNGLLAKLSFFAVFAMYLNRISCMCVGGLGAYFVIHNMDMLKKYCTVPRAWIATVLIIVLLVTGIYTQDVLSILYMFVILCIIVYAKPIPILDNKILSYFGQVTYGIYMYHSMVIPLSYVLLKKYNAFNMYTFYFCSYAGTLLVAVFSYEVFEKSFLRLKDKNLLAFIKTKN